MRTVILFYQLYILMKALCLFEKRLLPQKKMAPTRLVYLMENTATSHCPIKWCSALIQKITSCQRGITLEFNEYEKPSDLNKLKNRKGKVEINYTSYVINKGVDDNVFKK